MGRSYTTKYALEMTGFVGMAATPQCWKGKLPTVAQLEKLTMEYVVSTMPGYVNEDVGKAFGIQIPSLVRIVLNDGSRRTMVEWRAPKFLALPNPANYPAVAKAWKAA